MLSVGTSTDPVQGHRHVEASFRLAVERQAVLDRVDALADREAGALQPFDVGRDTRTREPVASSTIAASSGCVICARLGSSTSTERAPVAINPA